MSAGRGPGQALCQHGGQEGKWGQGFSLWATRGQLFIHGLCSVGCCCVASSYLLKQQTPLLVTFCPKAQQLCRTDLQVLPESWCVCESLQADPGAIETV